MKRGETLHLFGYGMGRRLMVFGGLDCEKKKNFLGTSVKNT